MEMVRTDHMNFYSFVNYLPQILGLTAGRLLGLGGNLTIYLSRVFITIVFLLSCYLSIRATPVGKIVFAVVPLLPMSMMLGTSISYDAMVIITALGMISAMLALKNKPTDKRNIYRALIWVFLAGAVKGGINLIMMPLILLIPIRKEKNNLWGKYQLHINLILTGVLSLILFDFIIPKGSLFQLHGIDALHLSASFALLHPITYLKMLIESYIHDIDVLMINMGGTHLAWLEYSIPSVWIVLIMIITGIMSTVEADELVLGKKDKWSFGLIILFVLLLTPAMLLSFTYVNSTNVEGLQGRYYLFVLPLIFLILTKFKLKNVMRGKWNEEILNTGFIWLGALFSICIYYLLLIYLPR